MAILKIGNTTVMPLVVADQPDYYKEANLISKNIYSEGTYSAITDGADGYSNVTVNIGGNKKYQLLNRVKDDSNNEIGTVSGFFTDGNGVEYAVVCLDAKDRLASSQFCSDTTTAVTDLPLLNNQRNSWWYHSIDTATSNCDKILAFCTTNNYTSTAVSHCRTKSYIIDGVTYYGQLPNERELFDIVDNMIAINNKDTTASSYTSVNFASARNMWSSSQYSASGAWPANALGSMNLSTKSSSYVAVPVLEIPNT